MLQIVVLSLILLQLDSCSTARILFVAGTGSKSHIYFFEGIIRGLLDNNHEMAFISHYKTSIENKNLTHILLPKNVKKQIVPNAFQSNNFDMMLSFVKHAPENCVLGSLMDPGVVDILKKDFDLILLSTFYADCFLSVAYEKKIPFVYVSYTTLMGPYNNKVGNPEFSSLTPQKLLPFVYPFSFIEKVLNAISHFIWNAAIDIYLIDRMEVLCREHKLCSVDMPSFRTLGKSSSLTIINSVRALETPIRPTLPTIIYAGGVHIKPTKPLQKDLNDWISASGDAGIIYFSLGSAINSSNMDKKHFKIFVDVFGSLPQRVIWKWDAEETEGLPHNIKVSSWFPQHDILAHPSTRLFITHGGLLSLQEATYFGVPVVGMPVLGDQRNNVKEAVAGGWANILEWTTLTEDSLINALENMLNVSKAQEIIKQRSKLMKDLPMSTEESINFWIAYVIRNGGAKHLESPFLNMSWFEIYNFDVWIFLTLLGLFLIMILILFIRYIIRLILINFIKRKKE